MRPFAAHRHARGAFVAHLEGLGGRQQLGQGGIAIVAGIERGLVGNLRAQCAHRGPALFVLHGLHSIAQQVHQPVVLAQFTTRHTQTLLGQPGRGHHRHRGTGMGRRGRWRCRCGHRDRPLGRLAAGCGRLGARWHGPRLCMAAAGAALAFDLGFRILARQAAQRLQVQKARAGVDEGLGCLSHAKAIDGRPLGTQVHDQRGEVGVRGDDAERIRLLGVQQLHGIHRHGHVGGVLALGIVVLLHGTQRKFQQLGFPALEPGLGPVAVGTADVDHPQGGQLVQDLVDHLGRRVVGVDQQGDAQLGFCHGCRLSFRNLPTAYTSPCLGETLPALGPAAQQAPRAPAQTVAGRRT